MYTRNEIHPTAIIGSEITIGKGNVIGPNTVIGGEIVIGDNNEFFGCTIGTPAQHRSFKSNHDGWVMIGSNNIIREYVTIHRSTDDSLPTVIGNNCYIMACAHIPHDASIESDVTICNNVLIGGHTHVMKGATIGLGAIIHQYQTIGSYSMVGMGSIVPKGVWIEPGYVYVGSPAKQIKRNVVGLDRNGIDDEMLFEEQNRWLAIKGRGHR